MRFLIAEPRNFSLDAIAILGEVAEVKTRVIVQEEVLQALSEYDGIWIRLGLRVGADDIPSSPRCRYVVAATTGIDHVDTAALERHGIQVVSLQGHTEFLESVRATAEHTLALLLALVRNVPSAHQSVLAGKWNRDAFRGIELNGKTAGIIGYGRLGRAMAGYLVSLGMSVLAYDPYVESVAGGVEKLDSLDELLSRSDVVSMHVALTDATRGMLDSRCFSLMKPGAFLVNTSRGAVINEEALLSALRSGTLAGAALDVISGEPAVDLEHPLVVYARDHKNLILTPHIGGAAFGVMERCETYLAGVMRDILKGSASGGNR